MEDNAATMLDLARRYPTAFDLRDRAKRLMPRFAFGYMDGGAGATDFGIHRNWTALDNIQLAPRYGRVTTPPTCEAQLSAAHTQPPSALRQSAGPARRFPARRHIWRLRPRRRVCLTCLGSCPASPSKRPRASRLTCCGSSSIASRAMTTKSASTSHGAPRLRA